MKSDPSFELVEVFTGNSIECGYIISLLEANDIPAFIRDEYVGTISPWVVSPAGVGSVKVVVSKNNAEVALVLISTHTG